MVLGNSEGGLWLVHSVPKFPSTQAGRYYYPHTGQEYGQSFLCVSVDAANLNKIGKPHSWLNPFPNSQFLGLQLQYNEPYVYSQNFPDSLRGVLPLLASAAGGKVIRTSPWFHQESLRSLAGIEFVSFAKGKKFRKDLYLDWVAPTLEASILVETWLNGPERMKSDCAHPFK